MLSLENRFYELKRHDSNPIIQTIWLIFKKFVFLIMK